MKLKKSSLILTTGVLGALLLGFLCCPVCWNNEVAEQSPEAVSELPLPESLDDCLSFLQYLSFGSDAELDALLEEKLTALDKLLQDGERPTARSKELLPLDCQLRQRVTGILEKHGIHINAGINPDNPCCVPY